MAVDVGSAIAYLTLDRSGFSSGLQSAAKDMQDFLSKNNTVTNRVQSLGSAMATTGLSMTKYVTTPLVGIGAAAVKVSADFEDGMARVKAISGATGEDFDALVNKAKELGATTRYTASQAAEGMENLASAGFNTNEIISAMPGMLDLAASSGESLAVSSDIAASTLRGFGLEADQAAHVADVLARNAADTNAAVADTGEAMKYVAPVAHAMGLSLEEVSASIGILSDAGIKGSQAGTVLRSALTRLAKPSTESAKAMEQIGFKAFDAQGKLLPFKEIIERLQKSTKNLSDEQKQNALATIFGQEALSGMLTLIDAGPQQLDELTQSLKNSDGAAKEMAETMNDTAKGKFALFKSNLEALGISIGDTILPAANELVEGLNKIVDSFNGLDESTRNFIVKAGMIAAATGPVLVAGGKVVTSISSIMKAGKTLGSGISKLINLTKGIGTASKVASAGIKAEETALGVMQAAQVSTTASSAGLISTLGGMLPTLGLVAAGVAAVGVAFYAAHEADDVLNGNILQTTDNMSLMERAMAGLMGVERHSNEELENMGLKYKSFSDDIAPDTQEACENIADKFRSITTEIDKINVSNAITEEDKNNLVSKTDDLCQSILSQLDGLQSETYNKLKETFSADGIDEQEQKILDSMDSGAKQIKDKVSTLQSEIKQMEEQGALETAEGRAQLNTKLLELQNIYADELKAKEKANQQDIQAFKDEANSLDLQKASELLQEKANIRDQEIQQTRDKYDETIAVLKEKVNECSEAERPMYEAKINELQTKRDTELQSEQSKYNDWMNMINTMYPELAAQINQYNGQLLSDQDKHCQDVLSTLKDTYVGIDQITESGTYTMYDKYNRCWDTITVKTDEATGQIIGIYDNYNGSIGGYTQDICDSMKQQGEQANITADDVANSFSQMDGATVNASNEIVDANGNIVGSLQNVKSNADGTRSGIMNLNGTPIRINCDKDGAINGMNQVINKANAIPKRKTMTISAVFEAIGSGIKSLFGYATGTDNAMRGLKPVAERGPELIKSRDGSMQLAMSNSLHEFKGGEKVYDAVQTKRILKDMNKNSNNNSIDFAPVMNEISKLTSTLNAVLNTEVKGEFKGTAEMDGSKIGEMSYEFTTNKLALSAMQGR